MALNTAFVEDGAFIEIPKGVVLEKPIYLLYVPTRRASHRVLPAQPDYCGARKPGQHHRSVHSELGTLPCEQRAGKSACRHRGLLHQRGKRSCGG